MPADTHSHFVFVDFENVPEVDLGLVAGRPVHVTLLIGKNQAKVPFDLVEQIHRHAEQVKLVKLDASGRNALDLTLACYLGQAVERQPNAEFFIVSKDKDFEAMIGHLQGRGVKLTRHESLAVLPFVAHRKSTTSKAPFLPKPAPVVATKPKAMVTAKNKVVIDKYPKLLEQIRSKKHRPVTRAKLMHHIYTLYGQKSPPEQLSAVINKLMAAGIITVDGEDRISYR